jgi:hypothetical protein
MRTAMWRTLLTLAAVCWLAAGPGGLTVREVLVCRHHAAHHMAGQTSSPADGRCVCDQMTGGLDLAVSTAVPTPLGHHVMLRPPVVMPLLASRFPRPASPSYSPTPPPPNALG